MFVCFPLTSWTSLSKLIHKLRILLKRLNFVTVLICSRNHSRSPPLFITCLPQLQLSRIQKYMYMRWFLFYPFVPPLNRFGTPHLWWAGSFWPIRSYPPVTIPSWFEDPCSVDKLVKQYLYLYLLTWFPLLDRLAELWSFFVLHCQESHSPASPITSRCLCQKECCTSHLSFSRRSVLSQAANCFQGRSHDGLGQI